MKFDWSEYKRRRTWFVIAIFSSIPGAFFCDFIGKAGWGIPSPLAWLCYLLLIFFPAGFRFALCACPQCGKSIHLKGGFGFPFSPWCLHCKLKIGSQIKPHGE
jgi:hypothetical protein